MTNDYAQGSGALARYESHETTTTSLPPGPSFTVRITRIPSYHYLPDLERQHLRDYQEHWGTYAPNLVFNLRQDWAQVKADIATTLAQGHNEIVHILSAAPTGSAGDPRQVARQLLTNACSADQEEKHLRDHLAHWGTYGPHLVLHAIRKTVNTRVETAKIAAHAQVDLARAQYAPAPAEHHPEIGAPTNEPQPQHLGTVTKIIPDFGAMVSLPSGQHGLVHISDLRALTGGAWIDNIHDVVAKHQKLLVEIDSTDNRGRLRLVPAT